MNRIGIDARLTHYRIGGISTYTRHLIQALEAQEPDDDFLIFTSRKAREPIAKRFRELSLWTPPHHRLERSLLSLELARFGLDILHSPDFIPPRRGGRKHIITVHDLTFLHYPHHKDKASQLYYNDQIRIAVEKADHILAVSEATKTDLITMLNVPADKITVQPHGVSDSYRVYSSTGLHGMTTEHDTRLPTDGFILHVGTLEPRKNISTLLDAYEILTDELKTPPPLVLVGRMGWMFNVTMARIRDMQAKAYNIIVRQDIPDESMPMIYNLASVLVMPSYYEGFGLPVLEAMACGTPVIASNTSSLPEVLGGAGVLIEPEDTNGFVQAINRALHDSTWRQQAIAAGIKQAGQFTWRRSALIAREVYETVAKTL